jgi:hypothetical protein
MTKLEQLVNELGQLTPDQIADKLRAQGIKGYIDSSFACPFAMFLQKELDLRAEVEPGYSVTLGFPILIITHPTSLEKFINKFDLNEYPDLVIG